MKGFLLKQMECKTFCCPLFSGCMLLAGVDIYDGSVRSSFRVIRESKI